MLMSRRVRSTSFFVVLATALALMGLTAPGAQAEVGDLQVEIVNQPADAGVGDLITAAALDPTGGENGFVQVHVTQTVLVCDYETCHQEDQDRQFAEVTFVLPEGSPSNDLSVESRFTNSDGIATFSPQEGSENPLSIGTANQPSTTDYRLVPVATVDDGGDDYSHAETESVEGAPSDPFDIWEAGCQGAGCNVTVRNGNDSYTALEDVGLGVSVVPAGSTEISCPNQRLIFASSVFFHTTTGDGTDVVSLVTHLTRADLAAPNNGQKYIGWCLGLKSAAPWMRNGARFQAQVIGGETFYVALAPACPKRGAAADSAPCIFSNTSDGAGGKILRGYVLGGDPPRRT
jgi:hypothetical protein